MTHVVLLGDSIFDNAAYVQGGPDVIAQVKEKLPRGDKASLLAVDGSVTADVKAQLRKLPGDATHLIISVGGNDALGYIDIIEARAKSVAEALERLADISAEFEQNYVAMLNDVLSAKMRTAVCTIYYPRFPDARLQRLTVTALTVFNDVILRRAFLAGLPVVDLRLICDSDADYANAIEPSSRGGEKIACAIARVLTEHDFTGRSEVFAE